MYRVDHHYMVQMLVQVLPTEQAYRIPPIEMECLVETVKIWKIPYQPAGTVLLVQLEEEIARHIKTLPYHLKVTPDLTEYRVREVHPTIPNISGKGTVEV